MSILDDRTVNSYDENIKVCGRQMDAMRSLSHKIFKYCDRVSKKRDQCRLNPDIKLAIRFNIVTPVENSTVEETINPTGKTESEILDLILNTRTQLCKRRERDFSEVGFDLYASMFWPQNWFQPSQTPDNGTWGTA